MVEEIIAMPSPDYDRLEEMSVEYMVTIRKATRPFSVLLFIMPIALILVWLIYIENIYILLLSVGTYIGISLLSIYSRYRAEKSYRKLPATYLYYLVHSDFSMYTIRVASVVLAVLVFVLVETYRGFNQVEFFSAVLGFIAISLLLNIFSPRFMRYERMSSEIESDIVKGAVLKITRSTNMPRFSIRVVPEEMLKVANAYCTGIARNRIYVTDYLLHNLSDEEASVIIAHELGHVYYRHNIKTFILVSFLLLASAALFFSYLYVANLAVSSILTQLGIFLFILGIPALVPSVKRRYELQADMFASRFQNEEISVNALLKTNYLNLTPARVSGGLTHPPLPIRINRLRRAIRMRELKAEF